MDMRRKHTESCVDKNIMIDQANRIVELKKEINSLSIELEKYKSRDKESADALRVAVKYADGLQKEAMMKYVTECERLRQFSKQWEKQVRAKMFSGEAVADPTVVTNTLRRYAKELKGMLIRDFGVDIDLGEYFSDDAPSRKEENDELTDEELNTLLERLKNRETALQSV